MPPSTQLNKVDPSATVNNDISPDGLPVSTSAAPIPQPAPSIAPQPNPAPEPTPDVHAPDDSVVDDDDGSAKDLDFEAFINAKSIITQEPKTVDKPAVKPVTPTVPSTSVNPRDFSDIEEEDKPLFERMSNDAFNKLKPMYKEHKTLKTQVEQLKQGRIPDSYLEHPDAFILTPDFRIAAKQAQDANMIYNHWVAQLEAVREGAKEFDYIEYNPSTNQYEVTKQIPADVKSETQLMTYVNYAQNLMMNSRASLQNIQAGYKNYHNQAVNAIRQQESQYFSAFDKPENKEVYEPLIREQFEALPPSFRSSPLALAYSKSLVLNGVLARLLNKVNAEKTNGKTPATKKVHPSAGPTAGEAAGEGGTSNKKSDVNMEDFEKVKQGW